MDNFIDPGLYIVATPIGNLEDITLRALRILKNVDLIAAEDTRNTSVLLDKYEINTKLISYHKFSDDTKLALLLEKLQEKKSIALVSDAGTPLISDPGEILVKKAIELGIKIIPIPGPSAITTLLSSIYRESEDFKFIGFLPKNKNQIIEIVEKNKEENLVFYESPKRLTSTLETIAQIYPDKKIAIGRELTKKFEEIKIDNIVNILEFYKSNTLKGEICALLYKTKTETGINLDEKIRKLKDLNLKDKEIALILARLFDFNKNEIYKKCLKY